MAQPCAQLDLRAILAETRIGDVELTRVPQVEPQQSVADAAAAMRRERHGSALVCQSGRLVGILTERDLLRQLGLHGRLEGEVAAWMTPDPKTLSPHNTLLDAVRWMQRGGYRRLPVVDASGQPLGIVDVKSVMAFLVDQMPNTIYNQASRRVLTVQECEGA